ncbi:MAG: hypothetical protein ACRCT1_17460 [Microcoleaceae cyanobacterium]|jgi:hypothetical protein
MSVDKELRSLMNRQQHNVKNRQQTQLSRTAAEYCMDVLPWMKEDPK